MQKIGNDWDDILKEDFQAEYFKSLMEYVNNEYSTQKIYPKKDLIFNAFMLTPYKNVKVVILGQDPYHEENQAYGLAFSVQKDVPLPPSLRNIFKELESDIGFNIPENGELTNWATSGVLLLNTVLTVRDGNANSHANIGWETFTDNVIKSLNRHPTPIAFILWGKNARNKAKFIDNPRHLIIESAHPSPLSAYRGFFWSKPFSKVNEFLEKSNIEPVNWQI